MAEEFDTDEYGYEDIIIRDGDSTRSKHMNIGYRRGVFEARQGNVQIGFDFGFEYGFKFAFASAFLSETNDLAIHRDLIKMEPSKYDHNLSEMGNDTFDEEFGHMPSQLELIYGEVRKHISLQVNGPEESLPPSLPPHSIII